MCFNNKIPEWIYVYQDDVTASTDSTEVGEHLKWQTFDSHSLAKRIENNYNNISDHSDHAKRKFLDHIDRQDKRRRCNNSGYHDDGRRSFQSMYPDNCNQRCHPFDYDGNQYFHNEKECRDRRYYNEPHFKREKSCDNLVDRRMFQNNRLPMYRRHVHRFTLPNNYREMSNSWQSNRCYRPMQGKRYDHRKNSSNAYGSSRSDKKKPPSGPSRRHRWNEDKR